MPNDPILPRKNSYEALYDYRDANSKLVHRTARLARPGKDEFFHALIAPDGTATEGVGEEHRLLYRLPGLLSAPPEQALCLCEGERDADRIASLGFPATTNSGGPRLWQPSYNPYFKDRHVVIFHDNDRSGIQGALTKARALQPFAASVRVHNFPDLPEGGDVSDWLDAGRTAEGLRTLARSLPIWQDPDVPQLLFLESMSEVQPLSLIHISEP